MRSVVFVGWFVRSLTSGQRLYGCMQLQECGGWAGGRLQAINIAMASHAGAWRSLRPTSVFSIYNSLTFDSRSFSGQAFEVPSRADFCQKQLFAQDCQDRLYTVSKKTVQIKFFVRTLSNFDRLWKFLAQR